MYIIEKLDDSHDRKSFDSGNDHLNKFLKQFAKQNQTKRDSCTHVIVADEKSSGKNSKKIHGFYTLVSYGLASIGQRHLRSILIARLAVDKEKTNNGLGTKLMIDAFSHIKNISNRVGIQCIFLDAKEGNLKKYYEKFGFDLVSAPGLRFWLPVDTMSIPAEIPDKTTLTAKET